MKKKKILIFAVIILVLAGGVYGLFYWRQGTQTAQAQQDEVLNTTRVRQGEIIISATGLGTIIPQAEMDLSFETSGKIADIYVAVGDIVAIGDEIALLVDDPSLIADYTSNQISVMDAKEALEELNTNWESDLAELQINYLTAKEDLVALTLDRAGLNYKRCVDTTIENLEADYYSAKDNLERLQDQYNQFYITRDPEDLGKQQMEAKVANAQVELNTALANWQYCLQTPSDDEKTLVDAEMALKQAEIKTYEKQIEALKNGVDANEIAKLEAQLTLAQAKLETADQKLKAALLTSPIEGTITEVTGLIGETVSTSTSIVHIADISEPLIEIYLDETDFEMVKVGYDVEVIFDAFPDEVFTGSIVSVSPMLVTQGNVNYVYALVSLNPESFGKPTSLPVGMNATVDVIGGKAENALLVPVEALKSLGENEYAVFVVENGEPKLRMVEVGLMDFTYAEIISGLALGDEVTTGIVETVE